MNNNFTHTDEIIKQIIPAKEKEFFVCVSGGRKGYTYEESYIWLVRIPFWALKQTIRYNITYDDNGRPFKEIYDDGYSVVPIEDECGSFLPNGDFVSYEYEMCELIDSSHVICRREFVGEIPSNKELKVMYKKEIIKWLEQAEKKEKEMLEKIEKQNKVIDKAVEKAGENK